MPVNLMPAVEREWPAHLEPIRLSEFVPYHRSRSVDWRLPILPWRQRHEIYMERKRQARGEK